jgi:hypothetical protein
VQNLDGNLAVVLIVVREKDGSHSAATELALERIATA